MASAAASSGTALASPQGHKDPATWGTALASPQGHTDPAAWGTALAAPPGLLDPTTPVWVLPDIPRKKDRRPIYERWRILLGSMLLDMQIQIAEYKPRCLKWWRPAQRQLHEWREEDFQRWLRQ